MEDSSPTPIRGERHLFSGVDVGVDEVSSRFSAPPVH